jgi:hypothetical protein
MRALLGLGFRGYWIDTAGYGPGEGAQVIAQVRRATRTKPIMGVGGRFAFFDLRAFRARVPETDAQLRQVAREQLGV